MLTRDEFYEAFPHVFDLPITPQCKLCFSSFQWTVVPQGNEDVLQLTEYHRQGCQHSKRNGQSFVIGSTPAVKGEFPSASRPSQASG